MPGRKLAPEEVAQLGLGARKLSPEEIQALQLPVPDATRSGVLGFAQGGTGGFADEAGGLVGKAMLPEPMEAGPGAQPAPDDTPEVRAAKEKLLAGMDARPSNYDLVRDRMREELQGAKQAHPTATRAGEIAGTLATSVMPVGGAAKGAQGVSKLAKAGKVLAVGAGLGGLQGLGGSEAKDALGMAEDTAVGGAAGVAGSGLGLGLGKLAQMMGASKMLRNVGISQARRVLTNGADSLSGREAVSAPAVEEALQSGAVRAGTSTKGALQRLEDLTAKQGDEYGRIVSDLEQQGVQGPLAADIADKLSAKGTAAESQTMNPAIPREFKRQAGAVLSKPEVLGEDGARLSLSQTENLKRSLQDMARYGRVEETPLNSARKDIASVFRQATEDSIAEGGAKGGPKVKELADKFVPTKQRLGRLIEGRDAAERGAARAAQRSSGAMPGALEMGATMLGHPEALALSPLKALLKNYGTSTVASGAYGLGNAIEDLSVPGARLLSEDASMNPERYQNLVEWLRGR